MGSLGSVIEAAVIIAVVAVLASFVLVPRIPSKIVAWILAVGLGAVVFLVSYAARPTPDVQLARSLPKRVKEMGYVTSSECRSCHPAEYASWHYSYHRTMTQVASAKSVLAPWDGVELRGPLPLDLERRDDQFWIRVADGESTQRKRVVMTTGSHHFQVYWTREAKGEIRQIPYLYIIRDRKWIPNDDSFLHPNEGAAHALWNDGCIHCHTTGPQPRIDERTGQMDTKVAELGIACEACHGPGARHVAANRDPMRRYRLHFADDDDPTIVNPRKLNNQLASQVCGRCHSISYPVHEKLTLQRGTLHRPGKPLQDYFDVVRYEEDPREGWLRELLEEDPMGYHGGFWRDGTVRVAGREFNGMLETACYTRGSMSCISCHSLHGYHDRSDQIATARRGDRACLQCHPGYVAQVERHTHHRPSSTGSRCYNCHMPFTSFGVLSAVRSHRVDSPSVQNDVETGRPNACNLCHLDRSVAWAATKLTEWYGQPPAAVPPARREVAAGVWWTLRGDAVQRAIAAWSMTWPPARAISGDQWMAPYLANLLEDRYSAVRYLAARSLRKLSGFERLAYDFVGPAPSRRRAAATALALWENMDRTTRRGKEQLLLDQAGRLKRAAFERHLAARDRRPVSISE